MGLVAFFILRDRIEAASNGEYVYVVPFRIHCIDDPEVTGQKTPQVGRGTLQRLARMQGVVPELVEDLVPEILPDTVVLHRGKILECTCFDDDVPVLVCRECVHLASLVA